MDAPDKRFLHAVLGDRCDLHPWPRSLNVGGFQPRTFQSWPYGTTSRDEAGDWKSVREGT